jgi:hypothetical protein
VEHSKYKIHHAAPFPLVLPLFALNQQLENTLSMNLYQKLSCISCAACARSPSILHPFSKRVKQRFRRVLARASRIAASACARAAIVLLAQAKFHELMTC